MAPADAFGRRVKQLRTALTLSQLELAARAGLSRTYLARVELGQQSPTLEVIERLARGLRVSPAQLLGDTSPEKQGETDLYWLVGLLHARVARVGSSERTAYVEVIGRDKATDEHAVAVLTALTRRDAVWRMAKPAGAIRVAGADAAAVIRALLALPEHALTAALRKNMAAALKKQEGGRST